MLTRILDTVMRIWISLSGIALKQNQIISTQAEHGEMLKKILIWLVPGQAVRVAFNVLFNGDLILGATKVDMKSKQEFDINLAFLDDKGQAAFIDGVPQWTITNDTSFTLTPTADGMSAHVTSLDQIGTGRIEVKADADLGEGVKEITGFLDIALVPREAVLIQLNTTPVQDIPEAPPAP